MKKNENILSKTKENKTPSIPITTNINTNEKK
jgi:hypothetical protein